MLQIQNHPIELSEKPSINSVSFSIQSKEKNLDVRSFTENDPIAFLNQYAEGMLLDEVHHAPNLLSYIQGMVDEDTTGVLSFRVVRSSPC